MTGAPNAASARAMSDPVADQREFRRCLGQYATGVAVITAAHGNQVAGMAVNSFAAVSLDPPLVLWSIRRQSRSLPVFTAAKRYAVNVLAADQVSVAQAFGSGAADRFDRVSWRPGRGGAPLLDGVLAQLECRTVAELDGGDHLILLGEVERFARFEGDPLVFAQGKYAVTDEHPALLEGREERCRAVPAEDGSDVLFTTLLKEADQHLSALFEEHRRAAGVTANSSRVLSRLAKGPCAVDRLEHDTLLGETAVQDALSDLRSAGLVEESDGLLRLTPRGRQVRVRLHDRATHFTRDQLAGIPDEDIAAATRVLRMLRQR